MTDPAAGSRSHGGTVPGRALQNSAWREADLMHAQLRREIPNLRVSYYMARQGTRQVESGEIIETMTEELARLSVELTAGGYRATPIVRGGLWRPSLVVGNPTVAVRTSEIIAESGWFWWPGGRRVGETAGAAHAARLIIQVLGCASG
jgi:hypothetical protein